MKNDKTFVRVVIGACTLAIVQGLVWMILSLLGLVTYFEVWEPEIDKSTHYGYLGFILHSIFTVTSTKILFLLFLNLTSSVMWIISSVTLITIIRKEHNYTKPKALQGWGTTTICICIFDIVGIGIFADEYSSGTSISNVNDSVTYALLAFGILFSIAARGYVLWCINLIFAIVFLKYVKYYKMTGVSNYNNSPHTFRRDNETRTFESSEGDWENRYRPPTDQISSYAGSVQGGYSRPLQYPTVPPKPNYNDRAPGFGRPQPNSFSGNVPSQTGPSNFMYPKEKSPNLPSPDYSPPNSPLKSAMKNKPMQNPFLFPRNGNGNNRY